MTRDDKHAVVEQLKEKFENANFFYVADSSGLTVEQINKFRALCFKQDIELKVVKNTLVKKALESYPEERGFAPIFDVLAGPTSIMFTSQASEPAKLIKEFRKSNDKPILKAAYIDTDVFIGDDQIDSLVAIKSKEELIGDIVMLLQSPAKNVVSALKASGSTIAGLIKALEERAN